MTRARLYAAALGLVSGVGLSGCPNATPKFTDARCTTLCQSARACGVIPSALGGASVSSDGDYVDLCTERCLSSDPSRADIATIVDCLSLYDPADVVDTCAPECVSVVQCMRTAVSTGDVGSEALGSAEVTVTMVPADFWLSTKENKSWCPEGLDEVPLLSSYYRDAGVAAEMAGLLLKVSQGFDALEAGLAAAADDDERIAAIDQVEGGVYGGTYILPPDLLPTLRRELEADGWGAPDYLDGDLAPGGCVRGLISTARDAVLAGVDPTSVDSVAARLEREAVGDDAFQVFSGGFSVCQQNADYIGVTGAQGCEQELAGDSGQCRSFGKPMCEIADCDGGLAGCDPLRCFYQGLPPSRACAELGIEEIYLGYESDGTKYLSEAPLQCDGAVVEAVFPKVSIGVVTPFAVVRGRLGGNSRIPGREILACGKAEAGAPAPAGHGDARTRPAGDGATTPRVGDSVDPFSDPSEGDYCWLIHGEPTSLRAGPSALVVPSPYVEYLKEAVKPAVRLGIIAPRLPQGCACEIHTDSCERLGGGNCRDGKDNDGNGSADYHAPECQNFATQFPFYETRTDVDASGVGPCSMMDGEGGG
ncbi:MAG: hypothetical protein R3A79_15410 [Nannocystaceae bacterium]